MIIPFAAFCGGVALTCYVVSQMSKVDGGELAAGERESCEGVAIMLWEVIDGDVESEIADLGGGGIGISHASVDLCETDADGHPLMIECFPAEGVTRSRRDRFGTRRYATVILTGEDAAEMRGCLRAQIGRPFDPLGLLGGLMDREAMLCSTLVYRCLPAHLRELVDEARPKDAIGEAVSPAQIALAFGATVGGEPVFVR